MTTISRTMFTAVAAWQLVGCMVGEDEPELSSTAGASFEEFRASTYQEDWSGGHYIVDGDTPIADEKKLYEFWEGLQQGALVVGRVGNNDDRWSDAQKVNLTYCVSDNFGANKSRVVQALQRATDQGWETMANINFVYLSQHDGNCTASNNGVLFDVRQVSGQPYLARAFFPSGSRPSREVLVDTSSFGNVGWPLENILGHELGHVLGFRHEHTRPEAGTCFEDNRWRPLTSYDAASIMHYPQCNGSSNDLDWTTRDAEGIASLYGPPGGGTTPPPPDEPPPPPPAGESKTATASGTLAKNQAKTYGSFGVVPGTTFTVTMTGTGDPDLYVRWGAAPTVSQYHCRPYLDGPNETCTLTVPSTASTAYVMVRGYAAATYTINVAWTEP